LLCRAVQRDVAVELAGGREQDDIELLYTPLPLHAPIKAECLVGHLESALSRPRTGVLQPINSIRSAIRPPSLAARHRRQACRANPIKRASSRISWRASDWVGTCLERKNPTCSRTHRSRYLRRISSARPLEPRGHDDNLEASLDKRGQGIETGRARRWVRSRRGNRGAGFASFAG